jgi:hypothetical protein
MALQFHAEIGAKLGKKALAAIATVAQPGTILAWNRKCADHKVRPLSHQWQLTTG